MNIQATIRLPGFTAGLSLMKAGDFGALFSRSGALGAGVILPSGSVNCNCGCPCPGGSGGTTGGGTPGVCQCSSIAGVGCSTTSNSCNPGFVPQCSCGVLGNSCQCVPSSQ
jgi:hypothetical protein